MSASTPPVGRAAAAASLTATFGILVAANTAVAAPGGRPSAAEGAFALLLVMLTAWCARGISRNQPWARLVVLGLVAVGLFFVLPITGALLLGSDPEPVGTGWDVVFFPLTTAVLLALLWTLRPSAGAPGGTGV